MPSPFSTPSIKHLEDSSAGVLPNGSIQHWYPIQSKPIVFRDVAGLIRTTEGPNYLSGFLTWTADVADAYIGRVVVGAQSSVADWSQPLQMRTFCYRLVDLLPDAALEEALTALTDYWEYYSNMPSTPALPEPEVVKSTFAGITDRPPLYIDEE